MVTDADNQPDDPQIHHHHPHLASRLHYPRQTDVGNLGQRNLDQLDTSKDALQSSLSPQTRDHPLCWEEVRYRSSWVGAEIQEPEKTGG